VSKLNHLSEGTRRLRRSVIAIAAMLPAIATVVVFASAQRSNAPTCRPAAGVTKLSDLSEASGVAASRRQPGRLWAHNDSGSDLVALTDRGVVGGRIRLTGAKVDDWEALAVAPCPAGSCLYIADIGDNDAARKRITIHRMPEPAAGDSSATVGESFHATYPNRAHDAETLLVTPQGEIFVVTKGETGPTELYRFPRGMKPGGTVTLELVGKPRVAEKASANDRITDGAVSPNGEWIVLRTKNMLLVYAARDFMAGSWKEAGRVDLAALAEPQGEGVAFIDDSTLALVGEGGGKKQPGSFARLNCTF
jgi:hypothetical protein